MADFIFRISPNIVLGSYVSSRIGQFVREWGTRYILLVDPVLNEFGVVSKIEQSLQDRKIDYFIFDTIPASPDTEVLQQCLDLAREAHVHGVIAIGGTKAANIGRAVAALYHESHDIYDYLEGAQPTTGALPLICIPTTIRDSFMFLDKTPIVDARSRQIKLLKLQPGVCKLALFDPNLTVSLTENQKASMTLQTLCIAIESYLSQKANFFSDTIVEKAVELLNYGIEGSPTLTTTTPKEMLLVEGGCMASLAASSSSIGVASIIAYAINARYKISRSLTTAILFPYMIEDASKFKSDKLGKIARIMGLTAESSSEEAAAIALTDFVRNKLALAKLPARLKDLGVSIEQLALAAEDASQLELMTTMPRSMTADDLFDIIKQAY